MHESGQDARMRAATGRSVVGSRLCALFAAAGGLLITAGGLLAPAPARGSDFAGSAALTSDDVFQGISRTCGGPAAQADVHFQSAGGAAPLETLIGAWGSAGLGSSPCRSSREIDLYAAQRFALGSMTSATLSYTHYAYPGGTYLYEPIEGHRFDYDELQGAWAFEDRVYLTLGWTPNAIEYRHSEEYHDVIVVRDRSALSFGAELHQPVGTAFTLSAGAGYDEVNDPSGAGYAFWNAGLGRTIGRVEIDLSYYRTAERAERLLGPQIAGGRVAASAVWRF